MPAQLMQKTIDSRSRHWVGDHVSSLSAVTGIHNSRFVVHIVFLGDN
jgi:hypothetical protein